MNEGRLEQVGPPREIYETPKNKFVAEFIGSTNFIKGTIVSCDGSLVTLDTEFGKIVASKSKDQDLTENQEILCSVRPEAFRIGPRTQELSQKNTIFGTVTQLTYLGDMVRYQILIDEVDRIFNVTIQNIGYTKVFEIGEKVTITFSEENTRLIIF